MSAEPIEGTTDMSDGRVEVEHADDVYVATIDRRSVGNAIDVRTGRELVRLVEHIEHDRDASGLILTGAGDRFFCTGGDLKEYGAFTDAQVLEQFEAMQSLCTRLESLHCPVVAAVNGDAIGGGFELILACDIRIVAPTARLRMPQVTLGLTTGWGGDARLVRAVGEARALDILLTGRHLEAREAVRMGLATTIHQDPCRYGRSLLQRAGVPRRAMSEMKRLVRRSRGPAASHTGEANATFVDLWSERRERLSGAPVSAAPTTPGSP